MLADRFIGQSAAIAQLQTAIDASLARGTILPHTLLLAPPGVGKTMLAQQVATVLEAPFASITMPASQREVIGTLYAYQGILLLDEIHQATRKTMDMLLPFLVDGTLRDGSVNNKRVTIIAATTDPQNLPDAFRSRFRLEPRFVDYTDDEIAEIIKQRARSQYGLDVPENTLRGLAGASLSNPRQAVAMLETYIDLSTVNGEPATAQEVLRHLGFSPQGLRPDHLKYLRALKKQGGVASQATVAQMVFMPTAAMRWVERDLLRLGIIGISSSGRELRSMAWESNADEVTSDETGSYGPNINPYTLEPLSE